MILRLAKSTLTQCRLTPLLSRPFADYNHPPLQRINKPKKKSTFEQQSLECPRSPSSAKNVVLTVESWLQRLETAETLQQLQLLKEDAFLQKSTHLALFLRHLLPHLNTHSLQQHRAFFLEVDNRTNSFTANLTLTASHFIEILRFRSKMRALTCEMSFLHNYGFEKKASLLAATFLHNRQFTFAQAVAVLQMVIPFGGVSLLLLINFIKYFKEVAYGAQAKEIKLEHLLGLLSLKFLKRNQIIIENTLYDHVLGFLLQNLSRLIEGQPITLKVETLCTLLCFDARNNYRADSNAKRFWAATLLKEVEAKLEGWSKLLWHQGEREELSPTALEVVFILECIAFAKKNMIEFESLELAFTSFVGRSFQAFQKECQQSHLKKLGSQAKLSALMRLLFNQHICSLWISRKASRQLIFGVLLRETISSEQTSEPLAVLISSTLEYQGLLLELAKGILVKHIEQGIVLQSLTLAYIQKASPDVAKELITSIKQDSSNVRSHLFLSFARKCCGEDVKDNLDIEQSISSFIKHIYQLAVASQSELGYEVALSFIQQHFPAINAGLIFDNSTTNHSELNALLSEESYYVGWLIFAHLSNGKKASALLSTFFQKLLVNDIIKFEILSSSYEYPFPQPARFVSPKIVSPRTYANLKFLQEFFSEEKYAYFLWDILLKRLATQPAQVREKCLPLVEEAFLRAYRKEKLRKVVMVTVLSSHIAGGVVVGPRLKLQGLFEVAADELVTSEELIEHHYNCYLLIVANAIAADILSPVYFDKLMMHSIKKDAHMRHTCTLMLLYGASLGSRNEIGGVIGPSVVYEQAAYLRFLIKQGHITLPRFQRTPFPHSPEHKREIELTSRLLAILFSFGIPQIVALEALVTTVLEGDMEFGEWRCVVNCYTPENYSMEVKREAVFRGHINQLMIAKLIHFRKLGLVAKAEESYFIDKLK